MTDIELLLAGPIHSAKLYNKSDDIIARTVAKNLGRPCSEERKLKISVALKGRKHSKETRAKRSASGRGRTASQETREKLSAALKGRNPLWSATKVRTPLGVFNSIKEATAAHGLGVNGITYRIKKGVPGYEYV
jgi:hypothetical protein